MTSLYRQQSQPSEQRARNEEIFLMVLNGLTNVQVGTFYDLSGGRVNQIIRKFIRILKHRDSYMNVLFVDSSAYYTTMRQHQKAVLEAFNRLVEAKK